MCRDKQNPPEYGGLVVRFGRRVRRSVHEIGERVEFHVSSASGGAETSSGSKWGILPAFYTEKVRAIAPVPDQKPIASVVSTFIGER